jgi:cytochrome c oxidase assembly factor CtaG
VADALVLRAPAPTRLRHGLLALGGGLALVVLSPPFHRIADRGLLAHMVQHLVLMALVPPLVVVGARLRTPARRHLGPIVLLHTVALLAWHTPALYDAAVRSTPVHVAEHLTLLVAGVLLWRALGIGDGQVTAGSVLALFAAAVPGTVLGLAMTLADHPWYTAYPDLAAQQLAGVVMWGPAGTAYALAGGALVIGWLRTEGDAA